MRLAVAVEHLHLGMKPSEIAPLFQSQSDYDYEKSLSYVEDAQKRGYKPFKCKTIQALGFCLPDCRRRLKNSEWRGRLNSNKNVSDKKSVGKTYEDAQKSICVSFRVSWPMYKRLLEKTGGRRRLSSFIRRKLDLEG